MDKNKNKIAIVSASLGVGGAERFASLLSFMLSDLGFEIHHIIIEDFVDYEFKGKLFNLGKIGAKNSSIVKKFKKGLLLKKYLVDNQIAVIIDNRSRPVFIKEYITKWIYGKRKLYYMIHSSKLEMYLPKAVFLANILYKNSSKMICVSKGIEASVQKKYHLTNTETIYNPIVMQKAEFSKPIELPKKYFLFFGRLEEEIKNFTLLLEAFAKSKVHQEQYHLIIMGEGSGKSFIEEKIKQLELKDFVMILPFNSNPVPYIKNARCTVLTSYFEGFPMSVVESLAAGIPVISVDCETGPKEIITNNYNGLLVENHNVESLSVAMRKIVFDEKEYQIYKNNAEKSVEQLSLENVALHWQKLLA